MADNYIATIDLKNNSIPQKITYLTNELGSNVHPFFSPDDKYIVFASERGGYNDEVPLYSEFSPQPFGEIYAIRLADHQVFRITNNKWEDALPYWCKVRN